MIEVTCRLVVCTTHVSAADECLRIIAYLGLMRCRAVPRMARSTNIPAAATYAQPRKGFFPPIQETVEMTKDFVPL
jgi:hypothetical protein